MSRLDTYATSTDYFKAYAFFDTQQDNKYLRISPCKDDQFGGEFKYFSSAVEVVFECNLGSKQFTEKINIKTLEYSRKQISTQNHPKKILLGMDMAQYSKHSPFCIEVSFDGDKGNFVDIVDE